ncbi:T9SS type A sorting domain-containing protein [Lacinutrix sp. WUR7]|uniref:leucine-rich repeat domain-containing protein n=1 Tax=Lacinutrix sp. WUR7 TaxID=2653681 RepID=UPI00193E9853|nr:T9SS type A sorting domain-containing protein [Lacinutrix sp. WUR7]QRM89633.1 T9SS type A sorting domain-containing protein [Lacinutrix sp. WUR7]
MKRLLLSFIFIFISTIYIFAQVPLSERNALIQFFTESNGETLWTTNTNWNTETPVSTWQGITVTNINGQDHVTQINLPDNNIVVSNGFPLSLTTLSELTRLDLYLNPNYYAPATFPAEIQNLTNLNYLDLRGWQLSGNIPSEIGSLPNLTWIDLRNNYLTGNIPTTITNLSNLYVFLISNNQLTGSIPDFSGITSLNFFWYESNNFEFGDFENTFANNQFIPSNLFSPQKYIDQPFEIAVAIGNSTTLTANTSGTQNNYQWYKDGVLLIGEMNTTLNVTVNSSADYGTYTYQATNNIVTGLTLQSVNFTVGEAPSDNQDYSALVALYNSTNGDSWITNTNWLDDTKPLSTWHGVTLTNNRVTSISLGSNNLTGVLPTEIGDFSELQTLLLWSNEITGNIPSEIGNLSNLIELDLAPNTFSGSIPPEIGNLANLEVLWLNQNGLTGNIPQSFQNLTNLRELYLIGAIGIDSNWSSSAYNGDFPDLTALPLETLQMHRNYFTFADVADEIATYQANITNFVFSPQYTLDVPDEITSDAGDDITLTLTDVASTRTASGRQMAGNNYQWLKDDVAISGAIANTYTITNAQPSDSGSYHCVITNPDTPGIEIHRAPITVNVSLLGIAENDLQAIQVYPNPTNSLLHITLNNTSKTSATLYNILGKKVLQKEFESNTHFLNIAHLPTGIYILKLDTENGSIAKRILKK